MKKRLTILALTALTASLCLLTQGTFAWFTDTLSNQQDFKIGDVQYVMNSTLPTGATTLVVPGQPLIDGASLFLQNKSDIATNLRVRIAYSFVDQTTGQTVSGSYTDGGSDALNQFLIIQIDDGWAYSSDDQCWHYNGTTAGVIAAADGTDGETIALFSGLQFNGDQVDNTESGAVFHLKVIFEAKQNAGVSWDTLGTAELL